MTNPVEGKQGLGSDSASPSRPQMAEQGAVLSAAEILSRAADLIEPRHAWTQGVACRGEDGEEADDSHAVCWCAIGAISYSVGRGHALAELDCLRERVERAIDLPPSGPGGLCPLALWNDAAERTQAEVVAALRKAAELARGDA